MNDKKEKKFAAVLSVFSNTLIIILKLITGIITGSISVISEAIHSVSDCLASVLAFFAVSHSSDPADYEHPFGHGRYEDVAGFTEGLLIILAAIYIIFEAYNKITGGKPLEFDSTPGIIVMGISVLSNFIVSRYMYNVAKNTDSVALKADAKHLSTDIYSSLGVLIGLVLIKITGVTLLDPLIAIFVALIILKAGITITNETFNNLIDSAIPEEELSAIREILNNCEKISGYKNLKSRKSGSGRDIDITLLCDGNMTLSTCHKICDNIEGNIKSVLPNTQITIHCEPNE